MSENVMNIKKQLRGLYSSFTLLCLSMTGAWVAILAARGFTLVEIGLAETMFHIASLIFEIPSGVLADVFGRKKMMLFSAILRTLSNIVMIVSGNFALVCLSMILQAMSYNMESGSDEALAYDSLLAAGQEGRFETLNSNWFVIQRITGGISTLCAGFALYIGYRWAYGINVIICFFQILSVLQLTEVRGKEIGEEVSLRSLGFSAAWREIKTVAGETFSFMKEARSALPVMFGNGLVGAVDVLLLFFLQAKLPNAGLPAELLGPALLIMQFGGIAGAKAASLVKNRNYGHVFLLALGLVLAGFGLEHTSLPWVMVVGGFLSAVGDDLLQVRTAVKLQSMFPSEQRATLTSLESFCYSVIMIVFSPLAGFVFSVW